MRERGSFWQVERHQTRKRIRRAAPTARLVEGLKHVAGFSPKLVGPVKKRRGAFDNLGGVAHRPPRPLPLVSPAAALSVSASERRLRGASWPRCLCNPLSKKFDRNF